VRGLLAGAGAGPSSLLAGGADAEPSSLLAGIAKMSLQLAGAMPGASASRQSAPLVPTPALLWRKTRGEFVPVVERDPALINHYYAFSEKEL